MLLLPVGIIILTSGFQNGNGQIWLDNVNCAGTETRLIACPRAGPVGTHNCVHSEDIGLRCATCTQGSVRLRGTATFGRLEVCHDNVWGTVCETDFGTPDAQVVCRQLGFSATGNGFIFSMIISENS